MLLWHAANNQIPWLLCPLGVLQKAKSTLSGKELTEWYKDRPLSHNWQILPPYNESHLMERNGLNASKSFVAPICFMYLKSRNRSKNTKLWAGTCWFSCQPDVCWPCLSRLSISAWRVWRRGNGWHQWKPCLDWAAHYLSHLRLLILWEKLVGADGLSWEQDLEQAQVEWGAVVLFFLLRQQKITACVDHDPETMALGYPRPSPCRMLLLTDDLQDRECCRQGEQGCSSLPGGKSSALHGRDRECPHHQPRHAELSLPMFVVASARHSGYHQIPECPHLWEFPCIPGGGLVTLHRLTAGVGAGLYPTWVTFTLRDILSIVKALEAQKGFSTPRQHGEVNWCWIQKGCELCWKTRQRLVHNFWGRAIIWMGKEIRNNNEVAA